MIFKIHKKNNTIKISLYHKYNYIGFIIFKIKDFNYFIDSEINTHLSFYDDNELNYIQNNITPLNINIYCISNFIIFEKHRNNSFGKKLFLFSLNYFKSNHIFLNVSSSYNKNTYSIDSDKLIDFYLSFNFKLIFYGHNFHKMILLK